MATTGRRYVWRDLGRLTGWNVVGHWVMAVAGVALAVVTFWLGEAGVYEDYNLSAMTQPQLLQFSTDMASICIGLLTLVVALFWARYASENAHVLDGRMRHSPAAAVYWYFVPVAFLVMPYRVMREIWHVAAGGDSARAGAPNVMRAWWGFILLSNLLSGLSVLSALAILGGPFSESGLVGLASLAAAGASAAGAVMIGRIHAMLTTSHVSNIFADEPSPDALASAG